MGGGGEGKGEGGLGYVPDSIWFVISVHLPLFHKIGLPTFFASYLFYLCCVNKRSVKLNRAVRL